MRRGAVLGEHQKRILGLSAGDAGDLPCLGVTQRTAGHRRRNLWESLERTRNAHLLPRRAHGHAALPVEPMRTGLAWHYPTSHYAGRTRQ